MMVSRLVFAAQRPGWVFPVPWFWRRSRAPNCGDRRPPDFGLPILIEHVVDHHVRNQPL